MIVKEELLLTVDEDNNPIKPQPRNYVHSNGIWHRTCHIWIINGDKQILCQRRSLLKDMNPGKWESFFGGHLGPNQDYLESALIEIKEELGINVSEEAFKSVLVNRSEKDKEFQGVFYVTWSGNINELLIEKEEIDQIKWVDHIILKKNLIENIDKNWTTFGYEKEILAYIGRLSS